MSLQAELRANRRNTSAFIASRPLRLTLTPVLLSKTGSGGIQSIPQRSRSVQTMRLIDQSSAGGNVPGLNRAGDGAQRKITHQLIGAYDSEMAVGDFWLADGARYEITELLPYNDYERRAMVTRYGL